MFNFRAFETLNPWYMAGGALVLPTDFAYQPYHAASAAAAQVNLINPGTNDAISPPVFPGKPLPGWGYSSGWTFDSVTQQRIISPFYWSPNIGDNGKYTIIVRFANVSLGRYDNHVVSEQTNPGSTHDMCIVPTDPTAGKWFTNGQDLGASQAGQVQTGVMAIADRKAYVNGVDTGLSIKAWTYLSASTNPVAIGWYNSGSSQPTMNGQILAVSAYARVLTGAQIAAISAAMLLI